MYEQDQAALNALRSVYDALEAVRQELREAQKQTGDHGTRIAVLDVKLASIEEQVKALSDSYSVDKVETAAKRGEDRTRWRVIDWFVGAVGGVVIAYALAELLG